MTSRLTLRFLATTLTLSVFTGACADREKKPMTSADSQAAHVQEVVAAGGVVDSILPMEEQLRRFRADLNDHPDTLRHGSASIDALVRRWGKAVESKDTTEFNAMTLDRAEFAWLYYPGSKLSKPPYEAPPQLLWGQITSTSGEGARKLLSRFGGKRFVIEKVLCPAASDTTSAGLVYSDCRVRAHSENGKAFTDRLFGSIVEHQGRFKFLGYANGL